MGFDEAVPVYPGFGAFVHALQVPPSVQFPSGSKTYIMGLDKQNF